MKKRARTRPLPEILLASATLVISALLLALAYASPPDPAWIPGVWDDADLDDVIVQVTSATGYIPFDEPLDVRPGSAHAEAVPQVVDEVFVSLEAFTSSSRATPGL